jgi:hypothetical protein
MLSKTILRRFVADDFKVLDQFFRFNPAYEASFVVKRDMRSFDSFQRFCQIIGHWELNGYGWYGLFDDSNTTLLGIIGAEYNWFLRNAEFTMISSDVTSKNRLTWMMYYRYMQSEEWRKIRTDTYAIVASTNESCLAMISKSGGRFIKEDMYAERFEGKLFKIDWEITYERFQNSRVFRS